MRHYFYTHISMSKSFGQSFRIDKSQSFLAMKVFCSWDFKVIKKSSIELMSENICTQLKVQQKCLQSLSVTVLAGRNVLI